MRNAPTYQMRVFDVVQDTNVVQLDVQVLVHTLESSPDRDVILEFDGHLMIDQRLEEAVMDQYGLVFAVDWHKSRRPGWIHSRSPEEQHRTRAVSCRLTVKHRLLAV